jgi:hypothetical protein
VNTFWRISVFGLIGVLCLCSDMASAHARNAKDDARVAARKASALAADGNCEQAVVLYAKAYRALKDAAILFNRAECLRKLGKNGEAIKDYEQFLAEMPTAPNRPLVEKRVEELKAAGPAKTAPVVVVAPPTPDPPPTKPPANPVVVAPPAAKPPVVVPEKRPDQSGLVDMDDSPAAMPNLDAPPPREPVESLVYAPTPEPEKSSGGVSPWVWVGIGAVVVAGAVVGGILIFGGDDTDVPKTALGNYKY